MRCIESPKRSQTEAPRNACTAYRGAFQNIPLYKRSVPIPGNTATPSCGFPQKSFPPEGPHDFRGHLRRSRKSDIAAGRTAGARLRTLRAPLGTHPVGACCASAPNKGASGPRTLRISECEDEREIPSSKKCSARSSTLRISFVRGQAPSIRQTAPSVGIQTPSFPSGIPPPRGIGDSSYHARYALVFYSRLSWRTYLIRAAGTTG